MTDATNTMPKNVDDLIKLISPQEIRILDILMSGVHSYMHDKLERDMAPIVQEIDERVNRLIEKLDSSTTLVVQYQDKLTEITTRHQKFEQLLTCVAAKIPVLLVGPAGTGKTHAAAQVAQALDLAFYSISVGAQTSKTDLVGYMSPLGKYQTTAFRQAYEDGGVFLMDEIDAGNPNSLIVINQALSAMHAPFPDGMVQRHEQFLFIGTANTFGLGANRQYVGRNQLDAATLDRFATIEWPVDEKLEAMIVAPYTNGDRWHTVVKAVRQYVDETGVRVVVSPRMTMRGATMLDIGMEFLDVLNITMPRTDSDSYDRMFSIAIDTWGK